MTLTTAEIKEILGLEAHPTCGFTAQTYRSPNAIASSSLPEDYDGSRSYATVLYFLVTPDAQIRLHRIRSDQMYHHYLGDPLEVLLLHVDGTGRLAVVGADLAAGMRPQLLVPGGTWHVSRVQREGGYALLGTTEWPGFDPSDLELGDPEELVERYPAWREDILSFTEAG